VAGDGIRKSPCPHLIADAELAEYPHGMGLRRRGKNASGKDIYAVWFLKPDGGKTTGGAASDRSTLIVIMHKVAEELLSRGKRRDPAKTLTNPKKPLGAICREWRREAESRGYLSKRGNKWKPYKKKTLDTQKHFFRAHLGGRKDRAGNIIVPPHRILSQPVSSVETQDIIDLFEIDWIELGETTKAKLRAMLVRIFDYAKRSGYISRNPVDESVPSFDSLGNLRDDTYLTIEDIRLLFTGLPVTSGIWNGISHANYYLVHIKALVYLGLRVAEMCGLKWEHVHLQEGNCASYVVVNQQLDDGQSGTPKTAAGTRIIHIPDDLADELRRHRETQWLHAIAAAKRRASKDSNAMHEQSPNGLVFTSPWGRPLNADHFAGVLAKVGIAVGITTALHPHLMRHTFCTYLGDCVSGNQKVFRRIAGWANRDMGDRYVGVPPSALVAAAQGIERLITRRVYQNENATQGDSHGVL